MAFLAAWQQLPSVQVSVAMASLGFDWLIVDLEHSSITTQEAEAIFIATERCRVKPFVRLPSADPYLARRLLDGGATGILVPVVENRKAYDEFAQHCYFPPKGKRGLGLVRANAWGNELENYYNHFSPMLIAQIETKTGADNIEEISSSEFLDGIMIGPYDLSASLNIPGKFNDQNFQTLCTRILKAAKGKNKLVGYHQVIPNVEELNEKFQNGYDFIAFGTDVVAIKHSLQGVKK